MIKIPPYNEFILESKNSRTESSSKIINLGSSDDLEEYSSNFIFISKTESINSGPEEKDSSGSFSIPA